MAKPDQPREQQDLTLLRGELVDRGFDAFCLLAGDRMVAGRAAVLAQRGVETAGRRVAQGIGRDLASGATLLGVPELVLLAHLVERGSEQPGAETASTAVREPVQVL